MIGRILGIIGALIGVVLVAGFIVFFFVAKAYRIPSAAMEPTLHCSRPGNGCQAKHQDRVLVFTFLRYGRGDIVVFHASQRAETTCGAGGVFVKRIIGLPGDRWQERGGYVYIDGKKLSEPYVDQGRRDHQSYPVRTIPEDEYFLMGDNRASSCDSRQWGTVPRDRIIGRLFAVYWPLSRIRIA